MNIYIDTVFFSHTHKKPHKNLHPQTHRERQSGDAPRQPLSAVEEAQCARIHIDLCTHRHILHPLVVWFISEAKMWVIDFSSAFPQPIYHTAFITSTTIAKIITFKDMSFIEMNCADTFESRGYILQKKGNFTITLAYTNTNTHTTIHQTKALSRIFFNGNCPMDKKHEEKKTIKAFLNEKIKTLIHPCYARSQLHIDEQRPAFLKYNIQIFTSGELKTTFSFAHIPYLYFFTGK
jgi:hypothetical protein